MTYLCNSSKSDILYLFLDDVDGVTQYQQELLEFDTRLHKAEKDILIYSQKLKLLLEEVKYNNAIGMKPIDNDTSIKLSNFSGKLT